MTRKARPQSKQHGTSVPSGPGLDLLQRYVLLITIDPDGAAELFATDADFRCAVNDEPTHLEGRAQIRDYLARTTRVDLDYSVSFFRQPTKTDQAMAEITMQSPDWGLVTETVLFKINADGKISDFEILHW